MPQDPSTTTVNAADIRNRLRGNGSTDGPADLEFDVNSADVAPPKKVPVKPQRPKPIANLEQRAPLNGRATDPAKNTPLPADVALQAAAMDELVRVRNENAELRNLVETAIAQEQDYNERLNQAADREAELQLQIEDIQRHCEALGEQVSRLKLGAGETGDLIVRLQEREDDTRLLTEQVHQLEQQLATAQSANGLDQYVQAVQDRDRAIESLNTRIAELEQQIADIPPPPPTDEELARMADELERERCKVFQLRKELDEDKRTHNEDIEDFERQMREMEVQLSKERAEMARQRSDLQRMQAEVRAELEAVQRGDGALRDRLAQFQRKPNEPVTPPTNGTPPANGVPPPPASAITKREKDSGLMNRLFGKRS